MLFLLKLQDGTNPLCKMLLFNRPFNNNQTVYQVTSQLFVYCSIFLYSIFKNQKFKLEKSIFTSLVFCKLMTSRIMPQKQWGHCNDYFARSKSRSITLDQYSENYSKIILRIYLSISLFSVYYKNYYTLTTENVLMP